MKALQFASFFLAVASSAAAAQVSLFGISLGQALMDLPTCQQERSYRVYSNPPCAVPTDPNLRGPDARIESRQIWLPRTKPDYLLALHVDAMDGTIQSIYAVTHGLSYQQEVAKALREKFGKPKNFATDQMENAFGKRFVRLRAEWRLKGAILEFRGFRDSVDRGSIDLKSDLYMEHRADWQRAGEKETLKP